MISEEDTATAESVEDGIVGEKEEDEEASGAQPAAGGGALARLGEVLRRVAVAAGPAWCVATGYQDPGNWATAIEGGSRFGYSLLWVLLVSNAIALLLQVLAAKLGIATGHDLAQLCRRELPRPLAMALYATAELAMIATDLAEFLGAALGLYLLLDIPLIVAVLLTGLDVFIILAAERYGARALELVIVLFVVLVGWSFVIELVLARPSVSGILRGLLLPRLNTQSAYVAIGMLGATVMPHNLYLHSALIQSRAGRAVPKSQTFRYAVVDSVVALNATLFVNAAILIVAAAVFFGRGDEVTSIESAYEMLLPLLGPLAAKVFALALLSSGVSSSTTATLAGQIVMEGFLDLRWPAWVRRLVTRLVTMAPAIAVVLLGLDPLRVLVFSQVALSFQLPCALLPLVYFTSNAQLMGHEFVNGPVVKVLAVLCAVFVLALNLYLIISML